MTTSLRTGEQFASTVCETRVIVVRAPAGEIAPLTCGGAPMVPVAQAPAAKPAAEGVTTLIGKRYVDDAETVELLCTHSGAGELRLGDEQLSVKAAKALPASD
ncbi:hypothetical protein [Nocardia shimofusensis]|uniref:hypothetical protein n=1 Tax=Nocardia shimofusensis TaxID=228596 RepID=UPI0008331722|nr:hypothetical protein [Nocardia shimofusensis]